MYPGVCNTHRSKMYDYSSTKAGKKYTVLKFLYWTWKDTYYLKVDCNKLKDIY